MYKIDTYQKSLAKSEQTCLPSVKECKAKREDKR